MAINHGLPGLVKCAQVKLAIDFAAQLLDVSTRSGGKEGMKKHALLHGAERIDVLNVGIVLDKLIDGFLR